MGDKIHGGGGGGEGGREGGVKIRWVGRRIKSAGEIKTSGGIKSAGFIPPFPPPPPPPGRDGANYDHARDDKEGVELIVIRGMVLAQV